MQLIPETSERFQVKNPYDPAQNIRGGLSYLRWLLAYFEGDVALVAAAYNAGEGKVERYRGVPPYLETRAYVQRILKAVGTAIHPFDRTVTQPSLASMIDTFERSGSPRRTSAVRLRYDLGAAVGGERSRLHGDHPTGVTRVEEPACLALSERFER